jgi:division/cell wall cluster transcriptional repressor MraZ
MNSRRRALLIGIDTFEDASLHQLSAPREDVLSLAAVLADMEIGRFEVESVHNPTCREALKTIESTLHELGPHDLMLLYYSGHGVKDSHGRLFLTTRDTESDYLQSTSLSARQIGEIMADSRCRQQILILDCCYSGAFPRSLLAKGPAPVGVRENLYSRGRVILTSSNSIEFSLEGTQKYGVSSPSVFTKSLVAGLFTGEADLNLDGEITVDELYDYSYEQVTRKTSLQTPQRWALAGEGSIVVALSKRKRPNILLGGYPARLDNQGRITIPQPAARFFGDAVVLAQGIDTCVWMYPYEAWYKLLSMLEALPFTDPSARSFRRQVFGGAADFKITGSHRITVPAYLREYAGLSRNVIISGAGAFAEMWEARKLAALESDHTYAQARTKVLEEFSAFIARYLP